jgi:hypothetical protein
MPETKTAAPLDLALFDNLDARPLHGRSPSCIAIGTGVVHGEGHKGFRAHDDGPFTSDLSGQDFWSLLHSGYRPVEMVMETCVYHVAHRGVLSAFRSAGQNVELENFTSAMHEAREIAIERMQHEAAAAADELIE